MEYPEMYYLFWWQDLLSAVIRFTPEKDIIDGAYFIDKTKPHEIVWTRNKEIKKWLEIAWPNSQFNRKTFTEDKHKFINWIFGEPR